MKFTWFKIKSGKIRHLGVSPASPYVNSYISKVSAYCQITKVEILPVRLQTKGYIKLKRYYIGKSYFQCLKVRKLNLLHEYIKKYYATWKLGTWKKSLSIFFKKFKISRCTAAIKGRARSSVARCQRTVIRICTVIEVGFGRT